MWSSWKKLTRIAGITFVFVYLAISGCAIIKMSAPLTYRLAARCRSAPQEKESTNRELWDKVPGEKSSQVGSFPIESPFTEFRPISSAVTTLPGSIAEVDARSMERWKTLLRGDGCLFIIESFLSYPVPFAHRRRKYFIFRHRFPRPISFSFSFPLIVTL